METTTLPTSLDAELLLLNPEQFRTYQPLPNNVQDQHFSAELYLVHQVVARRLLGSGLYESLISAIAFGTEASPAGPYDDLLKVLRPCLAAWAYKYALPNFWHLLSPAIANTKGDNLLSTSPQLLALMAKQRLVAEAWTQQLVQHLQDHPDLYPNFELLASARGYMGSPKLF